MFHVCFRLHTKTYRITFYLFSPHIFLWKNVHSISVSPTVFVLLLLLLLVLRLLQAVVSKVGTHMAQRNVHVRRNEMPEISYGEQQRRSPVVIMCTVDQLVPVYCFDLR